MNSSHPELAVSWAENTGRLTTFPERSLHFTAVPVEIAT